MHGIKYINLIYIYIKLKSQNLRSTDASFIATRVVEPVRVPSKGKIDLFKN